MEQLRQAIRDAAPEATETIAYGMPGVRTPDGRLLVSYAAFTRHCSLFPASPAVLEALGEELEPYFTGKGTIRFRADRPIPVVLVKKIVMVRIEENAARARHRPAR